MIAANSLTDRMLDLVARKGSAEVQLYGAAIPESAYRVYHEPSFVSFACDLNGQLTLELSAYLRAFKGGWLKTEALCFSVEGKTLFSQEDCCLRVKLFEIYETKRQALEREREISLVRNAWRLEYTKGPMLKPNVTVDLGAPRVPRPLVAATA